ncbi:MAG: hypothetical protein M3384_07225 [Acidobacteriota bacterium]|nr:hypothetical protein [Acidobacteriota bacterium]
MSDELYLKFVGWIARINRSESIPADLCAFNFGLIETEKSYSAYLTGAKTFDSENDDWACAEDFVPKEKYFELGDEFAGEDWRKVEKKFIELLERCIYSTGFSQTFLAKAEAITCGFDDGELFRIK